ncbi:MAG: SAM-dependent chlorinase/fluorinase [Anaerolineae bacterium]|nr:SAM-dependent chlorinase/fluorinase [Anaerolineae bacterium]
MRHITLLTDFGTREGGDAVMKGVIWRIVPGNPIADLSHQVAPQNIREAAMVLERIAPYFPDETVHVVVIDPGVGTKRRAIAARFGNQFFVGPDNGVCTPLLERAERAGAPIEVVVLDNPEYWNEEVNPIFHGRDVFAPCGGHVAKGIPLGKMGTPITDIIRLKPPEPAIINGVVQGEISHIDYFGNIITNIKHEVIKPLRPVVVRVGGVELHDLVTTFGDRPVGDLIALNSPTHYVMVSVVNGNAAKRLSVNIGDRVEIVPQTR